MTQTLYEKYGGISLIQELVEVFHRRLLADQELKELWQGQDWRKLVRYETGFLSHLLGGPQLFNGQDLIQSFRNCHLGHRSFDLLTLHLMLAFESVGLHSSDRTELMRSIASLRPEIITASEDDSLIGKGLQRSQDMMQRATQELEQATRTLLGARNLIVNQSRLTDLVSSLNSAQERLRAHPEICGIISELSKLVLNPDPETAEAGKVFGQQNPLTAQCTHPV